MDLFSVVGRDDSLRGKPKESAADRVLSVAVAAVQANAALRRIIYALLQIYLRRCNDVGAADLKLPAALIQPIRILFHGIQDD